MKSFFYFITVFIFLSAITLFSQTNARLYQIATPRIIPEGAPKASDVIMRNLRPHPRNAQDPYNTMDAMNAFLVTRLEWTYVNDFSFIIRLKNTGRTFGGAAAAPSVHSSYRQDPDWLKNLGTLNLNGEPIIAPWKRTWNPSLWACMNNPIAEQGYLAYIEQYIDAGTDVMQRDEPGGNLNATKWGGCFCDYCMAAFREYLEINTTLSERQRLGIDNLSAFNYRTHLKTIGAPVGDAFNNWDGGELKSLFIEFQEESTIDFHYRTRQAINKYAGKRFPMSCNNGVRRWTDIELSYDWAFGELSYSHATPDYLYNAMRKATSLNRIQVVTMPKKGDYNNLDQWEQLTRRTIATAYAAGGFCMVPWDVYMPNNAPRYFGTPEQYADLYQFIRQHSIYFDSYEDAGFSIPNLIDQRFSIKKPIETPDNQTIAAIARAKPDQKDEPVVIHLIDWRKESLPFSITLNNEFFFGNYDLDIQLLLPNQQPVDPQIQIIGDQTLVELPGLDPWGMLIVNKGQYSGRPDVWIEQPVNNDTLAAYSDISIKASAVDSNGSIVKVEFWNDKVKLGEDSDAPYEITWKDVAPGKYTLTAKAIDNEEKWSTACVTIMVGSEYEIDRQFIVHLPLDKVDGSTVVDQSNHNNNGIVYGDPVIGEGKINSALELDGQYDYVQIDNSSTLNIGMSDLSVVLWFKRYNSAVNNLRLFSKGAGSDNNPGYCIWGSNSSITASIGNGSKRLFTSTNHSGVNEWTHVALVIRYGEILQLFVNGSMAGAVAISEFEGNSIVNSYPLYIGQHEANILRWVGKIDDFRLYKRALNNLEISQLYQQGNVVSSVSGKNISNTVVKDFELLQNYPNPFNPSTTIPFKIAKPGHVKVSVYNILGQQEIAVLQDGYLEPGHYQRIWDATDRTGHAVSSGVYFVRLLTETSTRVRKILLLR